MDWRKNAIKGFIRWALPDIIVRLIVVFCVVVAVVYVVAAMRKEGPHRGNPRIAAQDVVLVNCINSDGVCVFERNGEIFLGECDLKLPKCKGAIIDD